MFDIQATNGQPPPSFMQMPCEHNVLTICFSWYFIFDRHMYLSTTSHLHDIWVSEFDRRSGSFRISVAQFTGQSTRCEPTTARMVKLYDVGICRCGRGTRATGGAGGPGTARASHKKTAARRRQFSHRRRASPRATVSCRCLASATASAASSSRETNPCARPAP
jgi:hypothetical protein